MAGRDEVCLKTILADPTSSTFDFMHHVAGYDLVGLFTRNQSALRDETRSVLSGLLGTAK